MKLTAIFLIALCLNAAANGFGQNVSLHKKETSLEKIFRDIKRQTGYTFLSTKKLLQSAKPVTVNVDNVTLTQALNVCFNGQPFGYTLVNKTVILVEKEIAETKIEMPSVPPNNIIVQGKITNSKGEPLVGASITEKGTKNATSSKEDGSYTLTVANEKSILIISYVGYDDREVTVSSQKNISTVMVLTVSSLNDVVVVGYGSQKKINLTGSVSSISASDIEDRPLTQTSQAIAGLATGVIAPQGSGRPGSDGAGITIRGLGTFSGAGNSPLVLVDGLASSMNEVDPNNIKSISVLKDAASAAIYGTRGANGVILIETKRGQAGKLQVGYNNYTGWQKPTKLPDFLPSWEYAQLRNEANINAGQARSYTDAEIEKFRDGSDPDRYPNVPHLKNLLNSGTGFQTNNNLSFSGGDGRNSYHFAVGYLQQNGLVAENKYKKYNFLLNFDSKVKDNLLLKVNLAGNASDVDEPRQSAGDMTSIIGYAVRQGPIFAGKKSDGTYGYQDDFSPEGWLASNSFINRKNKFFQGGAELSWEVIKGLTLSQKGGFMYGSYTDRNFLASFTFDPFKTVGPNSLEVVTGDYSLLTLLTTARYEKNYKEHQFKLLGGFSQEAFRDGFTRAFRDRFPNNFLYQINAGSSTNQQASGGAGEWALRSYFGRLNYAFKGKYLFEANGRYDGTSRFPPEGRWGFFKSFSAGWRISEESFIKNKLQWIDNLKLRASWGELGNQNIGNYPYQNRLSLGQDYSFGGTLAPGARVTTLSNQDITWETTTTTDIGVDLDILKGKLGLVFDYFNRATSGILYNVSASSVLGLGTSEENAGAVVNKGFEILLNYKTNIGKVKLNISPNFSSIRNKVTKLGNGLQKDLGRNLFVGESQNVIYGYEADGLFVDANDISKYPTQPYSAQPGFVRYKDISGPNGVPDGKVDATYDRKIIGTTYPKYAFGFTLNADYKGFDFSVLLQGLAGFEKRMGSYQAFAFYNAGQIQRWQADNRWTTANPDPNAKYIKLTSLNLSSGTILPSTFWNRDASFVRLKNLQLGYTLPDNVIKRLRINRLRFFVSGQNLFTLNKFYQGWDPEMGQSTGDNSPFYPITAVYTFGVNVKF